jgi:tetratricopeptide (TPR) repeat protein
VLKSEKDVLRQEKMALEATLNQLLISQKTGSQVAPADVKAPEFPETSAKLQVAQAKIETLQKDKETLRMEKAALEQHIKNNLVPKPQQPMLATSTAPLAPMENVDSFYATKIATLESQRDSLEKSLEAASKDIEGRKKGKLMSAHVEEMGRELAGLKARIEVLESHPVSYTSEELDMLSAPPVTMMSASHVNGAKAPPSHSANVKGLLAEGHRLFVDHQRDAAQQKFREALTLEPGSYEILSELASVQLDMGQLDEAEKNLKLALKAEPDDYYSLYVLGQVKFLQKKYDDALTVLSRAAQITPQDANVENVIGMTLSEKGLRSQAETAFRNAVRLDPNFAEAHYNLAVEYVTQKPPLVALARFHYQKATSLGHEKSSKLESMIDAASR